MNRLEMRKEKLQQTLQNAKDHRDYHPFRNTTAMISET